MVRIVGWGWALLQLRTVFSDDQIVNGEGPDLGVDLQLKAIAEDGAEHGFHLIAGEFVEDGMIRVGDPRRDIEMGGVGPGGKTRDQIFPNLVGVGEELLEGDVDRCEAIGVKGEIHTIV